MKIAMLFSLGFVEITGKAYLASDGVSGWSENYIYVHRCIPSRTTTFGKRIRAHRFWVPGLLCWDCEFITFDCLHTLNFPCALCGKG